MRRAKLSFALSIVFLCVFTLLSRAEDGACEQLGVNCHIQRHPDSDNCDENCRAERHREARERDRERAEYNRQVDEANRQRKADEQAAQRRHKAYRLANEAYDLLQRDAAPQHEGCRKAIELWDKALSLNDNVWEWESNIGVCADIVGKDPSTSPKDQWKYDQIAWGLFGDALKLKVPDADRKAILWSMWKIQWRHGRRCPEPPAFNGTHDGCVGNPDMPHNAYPYVPLPIIEGKNWTLRNLMMSRGGHFTITTTDGHVWHEGDNFVNTPMMNSRFHTDAYTTVRLTLPDGHDFVVSPGTNITIDSFVYDPNENMTTILLGDFAGLCRFVTGALQKAFPQSVKIKLGPTDVVGFRGTDVEVFSPSVESPDLFILVHDGTADFTDKSGKTTEVPRDYELRVTLGRNGDILDGPKLMNEHDSVVNSAFTDRWNMTPFPGRELQ